MYKKKYKDKLLTVENKLHQKLFYLEDLDLLCKNSWSSHR